LLRQLDGYDKLEHNSQQNFLLSLPDFYRLQDLWFENTLTALEKFLELIYQRTTEIPS